MVLHSGVAPLGSRPMSLGRERPSLGATSALASRQLRDVNCHGPRTQERGPYHDGGYAGAGAPSPSALRIAGATTDPKSSIERIMDACGIAPTVICAR